MTKGALIIYKYAMYFNNFNLKVKVIKTEIIFHYGELAEDFK